MPKKHFTMEQAKEIGTAIGIDWKSAKFDLWQFWRGLHVELEHGTADPRTNVTNDDPHLTGRIAWAHLNEIPDYYTWLDDMERKAKSHWKSKGRKTGTKRSPKPSRARR
ncbi:MAG: hypothetical protein N3G76_02345 [Candidatus Micrarchaeota archaeon]|nr:hypothetical protein [Candidatus Micrarchaeota archaeon]